MLPPVENHHPDHDHENLTKPPQQGPRSTLQQRIYVIIFGSDTPAGRAYDVALIAAVLASVLVVMLATVRDLEDRLGGVFYILEWFFTVLFSIEYVVRIWCVRSRRRYLFSFYGIVDLLAILPTFISLLVPGTSHLLIIRVLRVLRVFRILKLTQFIRQTRLLVSAVKASSRKITVFLLFVLTVATLFGCLMFLVEGPENGFTSIPASLYWAIVTLTTVGYGDIAPHTPLGQFLASLLMITGYAVIAVPTGIFTAELLGEMRLSHEQLHKDHDGNHEAGHEGGHKMAKLRCPCCTEKHHHRAARYCHQCGQPM